MHNFETNENHSLVGGGENKEATFKLDENGNKVRRYDQAYLIFTDPKSDQQAITEATKEAKEGYALMFSDCSDIPTAAFKALKTPKGEKLIDGYDILIAPVLSEIPNLKQSRIEIMNKGFDYDFMLDPEMYRQK